MAVFHPPRRQADASQWAARRARGPAAAGSSPDTHSGQCGVQETDSVPSRPAHQKEDPTRLAHQKGDPTRPAHQREDPTRPAHQQNAPSR